MGDSTRNKQFAHWIYQNFPPKYYPKILVLADGLGELSYSLTARAYKVESYEGKPRLVRRKIGKRSSDFSYHKDYFMGTEDIPDISLIVGMHPDEATDILIQYAKDKSLPFAVVPCCVKSFKVKIKGDDPWLRYLKSIVKFSHEIRDTRLPIRGKNLLIWGKPK